MARAPAGRLIDAFIDMLAAERGAAQNTLDAYRRDLSDYLGFLAARKRGIQIEQFPANRIKQAVTGHGHAGKEQVQRAIQSQWKLPAPPEPPDVADALAVALCCGLELARQNVMERPKRIAKEA